VAKAEGRNEKRSKEEVPTEVRSKKAEGRSRKAELPGGFGIFFRVPMEVRSKEEEGRSKRQNFWVVSGSFGNFFRAFGRKKEEDSWIVTLGTLSSLLLNSPSF
jgi:hypothetical protein